MKTEHTPGPWRVKNELILAPMPRMNFLEFVTTDGYQPILDRSERWLTMGLQPWVQFPPVEWTKMQEANASLISAAPDLLDRLEKTTDWINRFINNNSDLFAGPLKNYMGALDECTIMNNMAINKAKGL